MASKMMRMAVAAAVLFMGTNARAEETLTPIKISYQPAVYWALPLYVATQKGLWAKAGLKPEFSSFPAGVPQMAAVVSKSWDVGITGSVPAVLGYVRFGIKTIGISNDESAGNVLMARADKAAQYQADPKLLKGQTIPLTANSTVDYAVQACLRKYGLSKADVTLKNMGQPEMMSAISAGNIELAGIWAPNIYTLEEKSGAKILCSGKDGGVVVPGALVARADFAKEDPQDVAKFIAVYFATWRWLNNNRPAAIEYMTKFYDEGGVSISKAAMNREFDTRPTFDLSQQLHAMDRSKGDSEMDGWFKQLASFMQTGGTISTVPASKDFITDEYMKKVEADPKLRDLIQTIQ